MIHNILGQSAEIVVAICFVVVGWHHLQQGITTLVQMLGS